LLNHKQKQALLLLMDNTDQHTAEVLQIRISTLQKWIHSPEFSQTLQNTVNERKRATARLTCTAIHNAMLLLSANKDPKLAIEITKLGKSFENQEEEDDYMATLAKALAND